MMTFEEWCEENRVNMELMDEADMRADMEDEYREELRKEAGRIAKFGRGWLERERKEMRARVDEVLRILNEDDTGLNCKHEWLFSQVGELEYAQHLDILPLRRVNRMKDELFDAYEEAKKRQGVTTGA